jgi:hypothetical protein
MIVHIEMYSEDSYSIRSDYLDYNYIYSKDSRNSLTKRVKMTPASIGSYVLFSHLDEDYIDSLDLDSCYYAIAYYLCTPSFIKKSMNKINKNICIKEIIFDSCQNFDTFEINDSLKFETLVLRSYKHFTLTSKNQNPYLTSVASINVDSLHVGTEIFINSLTINSSDNPIPVTGFKNLKFLKDLYISDIIRIDSNYLNCFIQTTKNLTSLSIINCHLYNFPRFDDENSSIRELILGKNFISTLNSTFSKLYQLRTLDLSYNKIVELPNSFLQLLSTREILATLENNPLSDTCRKSVEDFNKRNKRNHIYITDK